MASSNLNSHGTIVKILSVRYLFVDKKSQKPLGICDSLFQMAKADDNIETMYSEGDECIAIKNLECLEKYSNTQKLSPNRTKCGVKFETWINTSSSRREEEAQDIR